MPLPEITALSEYTESINMLAYGDPGCGKTVLGGTVGENGLIIACEAGTVSAARLGSKAQTMRCSTYAQFADVLNAARNGKLLNPRTGERFEWLVIDTLTELQQMMIRQIMSDAHKKNSNRSATTPDLPGHMEWQSTMKRVVNAINDLDENILYLCHAMHEEDEDGEQYVLPDLAGKNGTNDPTTMARYVAGKVHSYGYLKVVEKDGVEKRRWVFKPGVHIRAKDRYGMLIPYVDNPNLQEITALVNGATTEGN